jgi:hypothetical protein
VPFVGYIYDDEGARAIALCVSNYERTNESLPTWTNEFCGPAPGRAASRQLEAEMIPSEMIPLREGGSQPSLRVGLGGTRVTFTVTPGPRERRRTAMEDTEHNRERPSDPNATSIMANPLTAEVVAESAPAPAWEQVASDPARALEQLRWAYMENKADFRQVAALEEPNVEVRDAVRAVLGLSPEVIAALGVITRLPPAELQVITATLALQPEVQATLRAVIG